MCALRFIRYRNLWHSTSGMGFWLLRLLLMLTWHGYSDHSSVMHLYRRHTHPFKLCPRHIAGLTVTVAWLHNYSWPAQRPLRPVYPQPPGSVRVNLGPGGAPLGFWIRASAWGLPDPRLVHPGPCPRGPLVRPGVRLSRSRPTLGSVTGPGSLRNGSRP